MEVKFMQLTGLLSNTVTCSTQVLVNTSSSFLLPLLVHILTVVLLPLFD